MEGRPLDVLEETRGEEVSVRLKDGEIYYGVLSGYDQHMNLVLGAPGVEDEETPGTAVEDTTVIRGDNVVTIRP